MRKRKMLSLKIDSVESLMRHESSLPPQRLGRLIAGCIRGATSIQHLIQKLEADRASHSLNIDTWNAGLRRPGQQVITRPPPSDRHVAEYSGAVVVTTCIGHPDQQFSGAHSERVLDKFIDIPFPFNMFGQYSLTIVRQCLKCRPQQISTIPTREGSKRYGDSFMYRPAFVICLAIAHFIFLITFGNKHIITVMRGQTVNGVWS